MRVENPVYDSTGLVLCADCPLQADVGSKLRGKCSAFHGADGHMCPTAETYAEACALAEAAEKGAE